MKPAPYSLGESLDLLKDSGREARLRARNQSLMPAMSFRVVQPLVSAPNKACTDWWVCALYIVINPLY